MNEDERINETTGNQINMKTLRTPVIHQDQERARRYSLTSLKDFSQPCLSFDDKGTSRTVREHEETVKRVSEQTLEITVTPPIPQEMKTRRYSLTGLKDHPHYPSFNEEGESRSTLRQDDIIQKNASIEQEMKTLRLPFAHDGKPRHYSLSSLSDRRGTNDPLSVRLASTFRSVRCPQPSNGLTEKIVIADDITEADTASDHVEIDAGTPPPVDESLFYDNLDALREVQVNGNDLRSTLWSIVTAAEMKLLLELEKSKALPEMPQGERIRNIAYIWACYRGRSHLLPKLEELGASFEYVEPCTGMNGLLAASLGGNVACIEYLIKHGADINCRNPANHYTPLHFAVLGSSPEAAGLLLNNGAKPSIYVCQEIVEPVLHCAIKAGAAKIVKLLLDRGASVVEKNHMGETPLHVACLVQSIDCVELLLNAPGTNINAVDRAHRTPLHFAVMTTHSTAKLVELLLKHGALVNAADRTGFTPLHIAALNEQSHCVDVLIWAGADVSATTSAGLSALNVILRKIPESLQVFRQRLDASIRLRRPVPHNREFEMRLHFDLLFPSGNQCETSFINTFVQERRKDLLSHPLVMAFLHLQMLQSRRG